VLIAAVDRKTRRIFIASSPSIEMGVCVVGVNAQLEGTNADRPRDFRKTFKVFSNRAKELFFCSSMNRSPRSRLLGVVNDRESDRYIAAFLKTLSTKDMHYEFPANQVISRRFGFACSAHGGQRSEHFHSVGSDYR
jgi:hypothetical protein